MLTLTLISDVLRNLSLGYVMKIHNVLLLDLGRAQSL